MSAIRHSIVVVGQTPPPYGGQAVMIAKMLEGRYVHAELHHVRMAFARDMKDMGSMRLGKVFHVFWVVIQILFARVRRGADTLYYPPSGPKLAPMLRDILILATTRWAFRRTLFHFHAAGTSEAYAHLPRWLRPLFWLAYGRPYAAIRPSVHNPDDPGFLNALHSIVVPNGIDDDYVATGCPARLTGSICNILFVGVVTETKGVLILIEALALLKRRNLAVRVTLVGAIASEEIRAELARMIQRYGIEKDVTITGALTGSAKQLEYLRADIFCLPTFFESESFGLVVVEAMQHSIPVVVTAWRGVQSVVRAGGNGFLVPVNDADALADKLEILVQDPILRSRMGAAGRALYLQEYTLERFHAQMDACFSTL